jgi:hypothetical protein
MSVVSQRSSTIMSMNHLLMLRCQLRESALKQVRGVELISWIEAFHMIFLKNPSLHNETCLIPLKSTNLPLLNHHSLTQKRNRQQLGPPLRHRWLLRPARQSARHAYTGALRACFCAASAALARAKQLESNTCLLVANWHYSGRW